MITSGASKTLAISHHPDISALLSCAAGSQPESLSAVMASHISLCPKCFGELRRLSFIGETLFDRLDPVSLVGDLCISQMLSSSPLELPSRTPTMCRAQCDVPAPLRTKLGACLDEVPFVSIGNGIALFEAGLSPEAVGELRLIKLAPGMRLCWRTAAGEQFLMVLSGGYRSRSCNFVRGDFEEFEGSGEQSLIADVSEGCIVLSASEIRPLIHPVTALARGEV